MQLTNHTDYALRTLIALAIAAPEKLQVREIAEKYHISVNHLTKVVQHLAALDYVRTSRGQSGGVVLAQDPATIRLGTVIRQLEPDLGLVECLREHTPDCAIASACKLKILLNRETQRFIASMNEHTLADIAAPKRTLGTLLQLRPRASS